MATITNQTKQVLETAVELVLSSKTGRRYSDLVSLLGVKYSGLSASQIRGIIWNLDVRCPHVISKPEKGLFKWVGRSGDSQSQLLTAGPSVDEEQRIRGLTSVELRQEIDRLPDGGRGSLQAKELLRRITADAPATAQASATPISVSSPRPANWQVGSTVRYRDNHVYKVSHVTELRVVLTPVASTESAKLGEGGPARERHVAPDTILAEMVIG